MWLRRVASGQHGKKCSVAGDQSPARKKVASRWWASLNFSPEFCLLSFYFAVQASGIHFEPSASFLKCVLVRNG